MPSAIDVFREQREAADHLHRRLQETSALLEQLRQQVNAVALNEDLRMLRFWPGVLRRWMVALAFALASAAAAGAGYAG